MKRVAASVLLSAIASFAQADLLLTDSEIAQVQSFGPWPPAPYIDPSNRVSGDPAAIALGQALFEDPILSVDGSFACASCHDPQSAFSNYEARAMGRELLDRNSPSLRNLSGLRWYGWAGRSDSLWMASLHPIIAGDEMAHQAESLKSDLLVSAYQGPFEDLFGPLSAQDPQEVLVNTAKTLAAFQETLVTPSAPFDAFRDALERDDFEAAATYSEPAQRGLKFFMGGGKCFFCHSGPNFTNNEFHDAGVPYFLEATEVDEGRFGGLNLLFSSPYTLDGVWSDDPDASGAWAMQTVRQTHADFGMFRTPSLRGVAETAPYMHNGSLATLEDVLDHYSNLNMERMHSDGEAILVPLHLTAQEASDLAAFLETLSSD